MKPLFVIFFICLVSMQLRARNYDDIVESGYITIAVYRDFPPYSYLSNGVPQGVDIDIGKQIARRLNLRPQWFWLTADENLEDDLRNAIWKGHYLGGGVADVMLRVPYDKAFAHMTDSFGEQKNDRVVLFGPYHRERWTLARNTDSLPQLPNLAPLRYHKVGVEIDSVPDFTLSSAFGGSLVNNVVHYLSLPEAVDALRRGEITAVAGMRGPIEWRLDQSAETAMSHFKVSDESIVLWPRRAWDIGLAVKSSYRQLGYALESEIESMVRSGEIASVFQQYRMSYELPNLYLPQK